MTDQSSYELRKQVLEYKIKSIASQLNIGEDKAFMRLVYSLLFNTQFADPDYDTDLVDGSGDKQIDIIKIEETEGHAIIHLIQVKNTHKYEGGIVVHMREALSWIFNRTEEQYKQLSNKDLVMKIGDIRKILSELTTRNVELRIHYVAKGDTLRSSPDFKQEVRNTRNLYTDGKDFQRFTFQVWGVNELTERSFEIDQQKRRIDVDLPIYRVHEVSSFLEYSTTDIESAVCTIEGADLADIVDKHKENLFEENVRIYLGNRKQINIDIMDTCTDDKKAEYFWFYNNGITMTCDSFHLAYYAKPPYIKLENIQIVNGCQTSMTLYEAFKAGNLSKKTKVLLKVFATKDIDFVDKITLTTNSQNAVSSRDLRSNDELQRNLEKLFMSYGYYYERKPGMFKDLSKTDKKKIISNEKVGQAHLAVVQHLPAVAMAQRSKIWTEQYYKKIFGNSNIEEMLLSYLIYDNCAERKTQITNLNSLEEAVIKYGSFHLARVIGNSLLGEHWKKHSQQEMAQLIKEIGKSPKFLDFQYDKAKDVIRDIVTTLSKDDLSQIINVFKSSEIQQVLDSTLAHQN